MWYLCFLFLATVHIVGAPHITISPQNHYAIATADQFGTVNVHYELNSTGLVSTYVMNPAEYNAYQQNRRWTYCEHPRCSQTTVTTAIVTCAFGTLRDDQSKTDLYFVVANRDSVAVNVSYITSYKLKPETSMAIVYFFLILTTVLALGFIVWIVRVTIQERPPI